ncbi:hypothetical protein BGZ46_004250 [Entomortierella lignicola]|nr:hypothetical protein BGZ46_004250 [Entomortierella lignicola]
MMSPRAPLTHFLAIPLYTPGAATRINTTLGRFAAEAKAHTSLSSSSSYSPSSSSTRSIAATTSDGLVSKLDAIILSGLPPPPPPPLLPRESLRPPSSIHLTLGVMSLTTPEQLEKASTYLKSLDIQQLLKSAAITADASIARFNAKAEIKARAKERAKERAKAKKKENFDSVPLEEEEIVKSSSSSTSTSISDILDDNKEEEEQERDKALDPIIVTLRGLLPMQSPDATTVLYTPPFDTTRRLQPFCEALLESFVEAGFIQPERPKNKAKDKAKNKAKDKAKNKAKDKAKDKDKDEAKKEEEVMVEEEEEISKDY